MATERRLSYSVIVSNIGTVCTTNIPAEARKVYGECVELSKSKHSRASGEDVTLFYGDEPMLEYIGNKNNT